MANSGRFSKKFWIRLSLVVATGLIGYIVILHKNSVYDYGEIHWEEAVALGSMNKERLTRLSDYHASKARDENNDFELANAYYYKTRFENHEKALLYADSIIQITQDCKSIYYPTAGYILRGKLRAEDGNFIDAMDDYMMAYEHSLKKQNEVHQRRATLAMAAIQMLNGQPEAAINLYEHSFILLKENHDYEVVYYEEYARILYELTSAYIMASDFDSASLYVDKGRSLTDSRNDFDRYKRFALKGAEIDFHIGNIQQANDTILKYINEVAINDKAITLYYLGKIHEKTNLQLASQYYKQVDSIISHHKVSFPRSKELYRKLLYSKSNDSLATGMKYLGKFFYQDSLSMQKQGSLVSASLLDSSAFYRQKNILEKKLRRRDTALFISITTLILSLFAFRFLYINRVNRLKLGSLKQGLPSVETETKIIKGLDSFENSTLFLNENFKLEDLVKYLDTNPNYLRKVLRRHRGESFPEYLNSVRINYAKGQLGADLGKLNMKGLAEKYGFKTAKSFSNAFSSITGIKTTQFLRSLKKSKGR